VPNYTIARYLADMCAGQNPLEISALIKGDARIFSFVARSEDEGLLTELHMPADSQVIFLYRNDKFMLPETSTALQKGDEVIIIAHRKAVPELEKRWNPKSENTAGIN